MSPPEPASASIGQACEALLVGMAARSPRTRATYASGLGRFVEYLRGRGQDPASLPTTALRLADVEDYHTWLVGQYGRERRATIATYLAALRALIRFLDRRGWAAPDVSYERVRQRLAEVVGR